MYVCMYIIKFKSKFTAFYVDDQLVAMYYMYKYTAFTYKVLGYGLK